MKAEVHRLVVVDDDNKVFFTTENFITKRIFLFADQHTILLIFSTPIVIDPSLHGIHLLFANVALYPR